MYTVTPESCDGGSSDDFSARAANTARATEAHGWDGILVPHNFHEVDPWLVAGYLGSVTQRLIPLIAVQPASVPPHTAAAFAATFATLYDRPLYFNLVAGARDDEMRLIGDQLSHDERYARVREYAQVLRAMLDGAEVTTTGEYYDYHDFQLEPRPVTVERCQIFIAGSSPPGIKAAVDVAHVVVTHPLPFDEWQGDHLQRLSDSGYAGEIGIRVGIICREGHEEAWEIAEARFPESWLGQQETLLKTVSQNVWARDLAQLAVTGQSQPPGRRHTDPYWLGAFQSGRASAPFLVGSYDEVAAALRRYIDAGVRHLLLNGVDEEDYAHTRHGIELAVSHGSP